MTSPLIEVKNVELLVPLMQADDHKLLSNPARLLSDLYFSRTNRKVAALLEDISFTLQPGERLGIIGGNGAGKSTLLRLLAGIYKPSSGELKVNGQAMGVFDITFGLRNEATGLENIYLRGLLMGLKLKEVRDLLPEILDFSELSNVIGKPLHTYSTGMRLRLAFSISTMIDPDILLLDEWIGAGDSRFQEKVKQRMDKLIEESRGLVLATHNIALMRELCTHGLVLNKGQIHFFGDVDTALTIYNEDHISNF